MTCVCETVRKINGQLFLAQTSLSIHVTTKIEEDNNSSFIILPSKLFLFIYSLLPNVLFNSLKMLSLNNIVIILISNIIDIVIIINSIDIAGSI